jgi:hypothetical protein
MKNVSILKKVCLLTICLFCGSLSASIQDMFDKIESSEPNNGLVFKIAVPKQTYFLFEPVTIYGQLINRTDSTIAVVLDDQKLYGIRSMLHWEFSSLRMQRRPNISGSTLSDVFFIPEYGSIYFALPDILFSIGQTKLSVRYKYFQDYNQPPFDGAKIWQGEVKSNELEVTIQDKDTLTLEEQKIVEEKIRRHIHVFKSTDDESILYLAEGDLVRLAKYSVPILVKYLNDGNSQVRAHVVSSLGRIADKGISEAIGFKRDISFLDDLISTYDRERDTQVKRNLVYAFRCFNDIEPDKLERVVKILRKAINQPDKNLREAGASVLLGISKKEGIPEVIDKIRDKNYFGDEGQQIVSRILKQEMAKDPNWSGRIDEIGRTKATKLLNIVLPTSIGIALIILTAFGFFYYMKKSKLKKT